MNLSELWESGWAQASILTVATLVAVFAAMMVEL